MRNIPLKQTALAVTGIAILVGLGTWQVHRLQWKNDIIAKLENDYAHMQGGNTPLTSTQRLQSLAQENAPVAIGKIRGRLLRSAAILLGPKTLEGRAGYHLLVPVELEDQSIIIANTGWVDVLWQDNLEDRLSDLPSDTITLSGVLRKADWNNFTSPNSPANNLWFRPDVKEIADVKGLKEPYPFMMFVSKSQPELQEVTSIEEHWLPRNKHLQYALFWYAMAATLAGVFGFYIKSSKQ